jgi:TRAP-type C4-dicarboxylate transport system permease large subunit
LAGEITVWIETTGVSVFLVMGLIVLMYIFLGMFLDPIGIILLTLPLTIPIVENFGFSLIWFGVVVIKLLEIGLVTPPIGLNVFVIKSIVGDKIPLETIFGGVAWFLLVEVFVLAAILFVPWLSLYLTGFV